VNAVDVNPADVMALTGDSRMVGSAPMITRRPLVLLALLGAAGCATAGPAPSTPKARVGETADDAAIEAGLPGIEALARRGQGAQSLLTYSTRTDHAGQVLAAWADPDLQAAWNKLHALSDLDHTDVWTEIGMGHVYLEWKMLDQAQSALDRALAKNPHIAETHVLRGRLERIQGQLAEAVAEEQKALELSPQDPLALDELGLLAQAQNDPAAAKQRFEAARKAWPDDFIALRALADLDQADPKAELADLDELHRLAPTEIPLWLESGKLREKAGDLPGAAHDFEAALARGSHDPDLLRLLAKTYREQGGKDDDERRMLADLVGQKPDAEALRRLAELELKAGDNAGAMRDYKQAVKANPGDLEAKLALARLAAKDGQLVVAIGAYRELVSWKPEAKAEAKPEAKGEATEAKPAAKPDATEAKPDAKPEAKPEAKAAGQPEAKTELAAIEAQVQLGGKPIEGDVVAINTALGVRLNKLYRSLLPAKPTLGGELRLRVVVKADGSIDQAEFLDDTVGDPLLAANLYWNARDAHFPAADARYVFKFHLQP
jgi:tetratricopeptide (TPR) repeat protein